MKALCQRGIVELYWRGVATRHKCQKKDASYPINQRAGLISGKKEAKVYQIAISRQIATLRTNISGVLDI